MYIPPAFAIDDLPSLHAAIRQSRLANLVTATEDGLLASPLPLLLDPAEGGTGHTLWPSGAGQPAMECEASGHGAGNLHGARRLCHAGLV